MSIPSLFVAGLAILGVSLVFVLPIFLKSFTLFKVGDILDAMLHLWGGMLALGFVRAVFVLVQLFVPTSSKGSHMATVSVDRTDRVAMVLRTTTWISGTLTPIVIASMLAIGGELGLALVYLAILPGIVGAVLALCRVFGVALGMFPNVGEYYASLIEQEVQTYLHFWYGVWLVLSSAITPGRGQRFILGRQVIRMACWMRPVIIPQGLEYEK